MTRKKYPTLTAPARPTGAAELQLQTSAEPIAEKVIEAALSGDMIAARLVLDKALVEPGNRIIVLPKRWIRNQKDAELAVFDAVNAALEGLTSPVETRAVIKPFIAFIRASSAAGRAAKKSGKRGPSEEEKLLALGERIKKITDRRPKTRPEREEEPLFEPAALPTAEAQWLIEDAVQSVVAVVIEQATAGDMLAAKLVLDKALHKPADTPTMLQIGRIGNRQDAEAAKADVLGAMANGLITPAAADAFMKLLNDVIRAPKAPEAMMSTAEREENLRQICIELIEAAKDRERETGEYVRPYDIWLEQLAKRKENQYNSWQK
jgi:hypothetical protein